MGNSKQIREENQRVNDTQTHGERLAENLSYRHPIGSVLSHASSSQACFRGMTTIVGGKGYTMNKKDWSNKTVFMRSQMSR